MNPSGAEDSQQAACNTESCRKFSNNSEKSVWIKLYDNILACDLYSLTCGVLFGELTLNSSCYDTKSYSALNDVYAYVTANTRLDWTQVTDQFSVQKPSIIIWF